MLTKGRGGINSMKQKGIKVTAATALLSATILGGPIFGSAHGGPGHDKGYSKDHKQSYHMMENHKQKDKHEKHGKKHGQRDRAGKQGVKQAHFEKQGTKSYQVEKVNRKDKSKEHVEKVKGDKPNKIIPAPAPVPNVSIADVTAFGDKNVLPYIQALDTAEANVDWGAIHENYRALSTNVKKVAKLIDKLESSDGKANLINKYVTPGEEALSDVKLALKANQTLQNAENHYEKGHVKKAVWKLIKAKVLTNKLNRGADDPLQADLQSRINSLNAKLKESYNKNLEEVSL